MAELTKSQKEFLHGYTLGYDWVLYEGGYSRGWIRELKYRGIPIRCSCGAGFKQGCEDAAAGNPRKYSD